MECNRMDCLLLFIVFDVTLVLSPDIFLLLHGQVFCCDQSVIALQNKHHLVSVPVFHAYWHLLLTETISLKWYSSEFPVFKYCKLKSYFKLKVSFGNHNIKTLLKWAMVFSNCKSKINQLLHYMFLLLYFSFREWQK